MGFWDRWFGTEDAKEDTGPPRLDAKRTGSARPSSPPRREAPRENQEVTRLAATGTEKGPDARESVDLFRALRSSPDEARAIDAVRAAAAVRPIPESLRVAAAAALAERGEADGALALLSPGAVPPSTREGRVLAADLHAERGDLAGALALIERVLVLDLDYPGARERHRRWRAQLGLDAASLPRIDASAVTVVSREPDAPFVLLREVGRGGAGAVYEAEDRELGRRVALKVYHHPEGSRGQLVHEARVAAALASPGIVRVFDVDPERGWLALEWAELGSLRQHIRGTDPTRVAPIGRWALPLATAIAGVHAAGWVHHDVKPANVLLASQDRPLLADFGSARRAGEPAPPGSLGYVSPERLGGRASDPRDDVFGFGRILEDALVALNGALEPRERAAWQALAAACTGPDASRPADARALVTRLRVETPT